MASRTDVRSTFAQRRRCNTSKQGPRSLARMFDLSPPRKSTYSEGGDTMSTTESEVQTDLFGELVAQLKSEIDGLEMIEKPSATRLTQGGRTLGYLRGSKRGASIEIPAGHGAYDKVLVKQGSDVPKVVKAVVKYAKLAETAATEKAAEKEKAAAEKKAKAAAEKAAKKEADAKAKAEAAAAAEPPADADGVVTEG